MDVTAVVLILFLIVIIPAKYFASRFRKVLKQHRYDEELGIIFLWFWDGTPEDELYAWYKVRTVLKRREGERNKVEHVDQKIASLNKKRMLGSHSVNRSGELVDETTNVALEG